MLVVVQLWSAVYCESCVVVVVDTIAHTETMVGKVCAAAGRALSVACNRAQPTYFSPALLPPPAERFQSPGPQQKTPLLLLLLLLLVAAKRPINPRTRHR